MGGVNLTQIQKDQQGLHADNGAPMDSHSLSPAGFRHTVNKGLCSGALGPGTLSCLSSDPALGNRPS